MSKKYSLYNLMKYFIIVLAVGISLQILDFNLSVLIAGSAALLVGLGLGLQNLFSDYVSGIIILFDSTVKVGDVIEINGLVCKVEEINLRTTTVLTRNDKYIILPNTDLTRNQLINWTHSDIASRFEVNVGVDYSSDVKLVMKILFEAAINQPGVLKNPKPFTRFTDFGESSLNFSIIFWSEDVFRVENIKSELRVKIFDKLNENNITIPFPQRVVHTKQSS
ncbi:MAG: mechanosensitive ion channel protein MscS [Flavobacteriales bacterium CG_4_9_14_3_um_filter_40_17]|nr:MAG: mechanosensitive ion channel protein MscS [Flavobacteriales bacterium CG_4_9_14_3_um_filter_40_17]